MKDHTAYFNNMGVALKFYEGVLEKAKYKGNFIMSVVAGGHSKYRPNGAFTYYVTWTTEEVSRGKNLLQKV